ncbi:MAG: hypothetical protein M1836_007811 [Candelina mexicana]|nr:MAG: hypothetical protein M1836_007811 [Candelina mexicana]
MESLPSSRAPEAMDTANEKIVYPSLPMPNSSQDSTKLGQSEMPMGGTPSTPYRPSPNMAKRRCQTPTLMRTTASLSHSTKMSQIFQDAQASLQPGFVVSNTASKGLSSNTKRTRIPRLQFQYGMPYDNEIPPLTASNRSLGNFSPSEKAQTTQLAPLYADTPPDLPCSPLYPTPQQLFSPEIDTACLNMSEPISSGFATPLGTKSRHRVQTSCSILRQSNKSHGVSSEKTTLEESLTPYEDGMEGVLQSSPSICLPMHGPCPRQRVFHLDRKDEVNGVDAWLNDIPDLSPGNTPSIKRDRKQEPQKLTRRTPPWRNQAQDSRKVTVPRSQSLSPTKIPQRPRSNSNKENQSPQKVSPAQATGVPTNVLYRHGEQPAYLPETPHRSVMGRLVSSKTPSSYRFTDYSDESKEPTRTKQATAPRGLFLQPARRKQRKASTDFSLGQLRIVNKDSFVIAEDEETAITLSPDVEHYRKDKRPRRNRRASYFDEDIIVSPTARKTAEGRVEDSNTDVRARKGRMVLGDSVLSADLTKPKTFVEGVEEHGFFGEKD